MTRIYFVRHAQPDSSHEDDRTKPLTARGMEDRKQVTAALSGLPISVFYSSPYKRSYDTVAHCAASFNLPIKTDERFRERVAGSDVLQITEGLERRWADFTFCEPDGETIGACQARNVEALKEVLAAHDGESVVIGTHGTALASILNYCDPSFVCAGFRRIWHYMPYILRVDFKGGEYAGREELLVVESGY